MENQEYLGKWEKRYHPLRMEWVVYAAHRNARPWDGETTTKASKPVEYDANCYLCPGNTRVGGIKNPKYTDVFIFDNDHPVVGLTSPKVEESTHNGLYKRASANGVAKVVCYDPSHHVTLSDVPVENVAKVFLAWQEQTHEFAAMPEIRSVLIFENKGKVVGVSNPHPHCQIYAVDFDLALVSKELEATAKYRQENNRNLFEDIIQAEKEDELRIIAENDFAIAFIPFFARYAYEVMVFPKKRHADLRSLSPEEISGLAAVFQEVTRRYDMNYQMSFPYVMSIFQAPVDGVNYEDYHMHILFQPPLRQPGLQKYLAGPEIGAGNFMADTIPEEKAAELRAVNVSKFPNF